MSLYHNAKPKIWEMNIKGEAAVTTNKYSDGYIFPCNKKCLVVACCDLYCVSVFDYMNFIADEINHMTADQVHTYRTTTPGAIKRKIQEFYTYGKRLAYPETATVSRNWK